MPFSLFIGLFLILAAMITLLKATRKQEHTRRAVAALLYILTLLLVLFLFIGFFLGLILFSHYEWQWFLLPPFALLLLFLAGHLVNSL